MTNSILSIEVFPARSMAVYYSIVLVPPPAPSTACRLDRRLTADHDETVGPLRGTWGVSQEQSPEEARFSCCWQPIESGLTKETLVTDLVT